MRIADDRELSVMLHSAHRKAEHPGFVALQPICDLIEAAALWLAGGHKRDRSSRPSLPPRA